MGLTMRRRYVTTDVFTDHCFGGNPLAVVLDAEGFVETLHAGDRYRVQLFGNHVRAATAEPGSYRPGSHLHAAYRGAVRGPSERDRFR
jgi:hypothetical protein